MQSATSSGHLAVVEVLLAAGADPKRGNAGGRTALHYAASKGRSAIGLALLAAGASANAVDKVGVGEIEEGSREEMSLTRGLTHKCCEYLARWGAHLCTGQQARAFQKW